MARAGPPPTVDPEVARLVDRAREGDGDAFARLYDRYVQTVFAYIYRRLGTREVAEDLTSDVFLRAWNGFHRFEWRGVDPGAWLVTIARNRVRDHVKSARFQRERPTDLLTESPDPSTIDAPDQTVERDELRSQVDLALARLSPDHREVIELRFVHDLAVPETAAVLGRTIGATKALQYRALKALASELRDQPGMAGHLPIGLRSMLLALGLVP